MKKTIFLFIALLILWIAGCTYCYVCNIRKDCSIENAGALTVQKADSLNSDSPTALEPVVQVPPAIFSVYFDFNMSTCELTDADKQHIELYKKYLAENPGKRISVSGHSDDKGTAQAKSRISIARASFMKQKLQESGIEPNLIDEAGKGDAEFAADNASPEALARSRRVDIQIK